MSAGPSSQSETAWAWLQTQLAGRAVPPVLTIVGLGDGSLLDALDAHAPGTRVLVVEPDAARAALTRSKVDAWRRSGRLLHFVAPRFEGADQGWRLFPARFEEPPLLVHPASASSPDLRAAVTVLRKVVFGAKANAEARRRFAPRYLLNSIRNLPAILAGRDVRDLTGYAPGVPAVVVGAGPSLDRSLDDLKHLGPRAVIVATDTALRPLLARGITPQFVVALDPSEVNCRHLLDLPPCADTWLVAESALDPRAAVAFAGRTLWFRVAPHQPWPWLNELGIDVGRLDVWGSVLTAGFQVAALAGCDPIVMVGADLSFPDGRPYARGTTYEFDWAWAAAHGTPVDESWQTLLKSRKDLRVERDLTGADTPTTSVLLEFRDWIVAQARKGKRRLVNATGRGMLFGDGVEQATLSDVLIEGRSRPALLERRERAGAPEVPALTASLRAVSASLATGVLDRHPLPAWQEFSGDGFDAARVAEAVADAAFALKSVVAAGGAVASAATIDLGDSRLASLPEATSRLRSALLGGTPSAMDGRSRSERTASLLDALKRFALVVEAVRRGPDFVNLPDPTMLGTVPAGALVMWPEHLRWAALEVEALLSEAWDRSVGAPTGVGYAEGSIQFPDRVPAAEAASVPATHLYAPHGCLLLAVEWLRCASSLGQHSGLRDAIERLWALQALLQRAVHFPPPASPSAEFVLQAATGAGLVEVLLPLGVCEAALARVLTGTIRLEGGEAWLLGADTIGDLEVQVAVRVTGRTPAMLPRARALVATPRPLTSGSGRPIKVAGQAPGAALALVDFGTDTMLVRANGCMEPHQTWPRLITGALSLGASGDVAWSNVWQPQRGLTPCLLYRPEPGAEVVAFELPFRPARGVWWRDRLYLTVLPTRDSGGAVATWAPGEKPAIVLRDLPLQGIVPMGDELLLEPFVPGTPQTVGRQRAERGWRWTPGAPPEVRDLGPLGASSDLAVNGDWSARAYPQADVVTLAHRDGARFDLRCYNPLRVGWAEGSLIVSGTGGDTLIFEQLIEAVEVR